MSRHRVAFSAERQGRRNAKVGPKTFNPEIGLFLRRSKETSSEGAVCGGVRERWVGWNGVCR